MCGKGTEDDTAQLAGAEDEDGVADCHGVWKARRESLQTWECQKYRVKTIT